MWGDTYDSVLSLSHTSATPRHLLQRLSVSGLASITGADCTPHPGLRDPVLQEVWQVRKNIAPCLFHVREVRPISPPTSDILVVRRNSVLVVVTVFWGETPCSLIDGYQCFMSHSRSSNLNMEAVDSSETLGIYPCNYMVRYPRRP